MKYMFIIIIFKDKEHGNKQKHNSCLYCCRDDFSYVDDA